MANKADIAAKNRTPQEMGKPNATVKARVVANYGDVGLTETKYFDILSRFLIVMIEDTDRIPTSTNTHQLFALVKRPRDLWIDADGGVGTSAVNQLRSDTIGNVNKGSPGSFSISNIPPIDKPYALGEQIVIRKMDKPIYFNDSFFSSSYDSSHFLPSDILYNDAYLTRDPPGPQNISNNVTKWGENRIYPLFPAAGTRGVRLFGKSFNGTQLGAILQNPSQKTVNNSGKPVQTIPSPINYDYQYAIGLGKYQFEVFWRYIAVNSANTVDLLIQGNYKVGNYNDDYLWSYTNNPNCTLLYNCCGWEDLNLGQKRRTPENECLPLVIASPNSFPIPKTRQAGSIKFDPTFSQVIYR